MIHCAAQHPLYFTHSSLTVGFLFVDPFLMASNIPRYRPCTVHAILHLRVPCGFSPLPRHKSIEATCEVSPDKPPALTQLHILYNWPCLKAWVKKEV